MDGLKICDDNRVYLELGILIAAAKACMEGSAGALWPAVQSQWNFCRTLLVQLLENWKAL